MRLQPVRSAVLLFDANWHTGMAGVPPEHIQRAIEVAKRVETEALELQARLRRGQLAQLDALARAANQPAVAATQTIGSLGVASGVQTGSYGPSPGRFGPRREEQDIAFQLEQDFLGTRTAETPGNNYGFN